MNVDANLTTSTKFTQSYSEANFILFYNLFLAALGLHCCMWAFSSCVERGYSVAVHGLFIEVASLVGEHGL